MMELLNRYRKFSIRGETCEDMSVGVKESVVSGEHVIAAYKNVSVEEKHCNGRL